MPAKGWRKDNPMKGYLHVRLSPKDYEMIAYCIENSIIDFQPKVFKTKSEFIKFLIKQYYISLKNIETSNKIDDRYFEGIPF